MKTVTLREGKERALLRRHPWVFESAVAHGKADAGETVRVQAHDGQFLAWASFSPNSQIRLRAWSHTPSDRIDAAFLGQRIQRAVALRERLAVPSNGVRLVHGEADGLPGFIVDRYDDVLSVQFLSSGAERFKAVLTEALIQCTGVERVYERSDAQSRTLEGLPEATGWLRGGGATEVSIREHGWNLTLDVASGHKTGFYLDQRDNRQAFADAVRHYGCARVLNCFSYTGGFSVAALAGGARHVTSVDSSAPALQRAAAHARLNGFDESRHSVLDADVNQTLRRALDAGETFDAIVLDPPKFAPTVTHAERAARAYKDINRLALQLLSPGGLLFTFSCSGGISADLFHKIVAGAGIDAQVDAAFLARLGAAPDHPMTVRFPEGEYLKGLVLLKQ